MVATCSGARMNLLTDIPGGGSSTVRQYLENGDHRNEIYRKQPNKNLETRIEADWG